MPKTPIPEYWSAREALAVYEFIDDLRDLIWNRYASELQELMMAERKTVSDDFDEYDDINF